MTRRALPQYYENTAWTELFDFTDNALSFVPSTGVIEKTVDPETGRPALKWSGMSDGSTLRDLSFTPAVPFTLDDIAAHPIKFNIRVNKPSVCIHLIFGMTGLTLDKKRNYFFAAGSIGVGLNGMLTHLALPADPSNPVQTWTGTGDTSLNVDIFSMLLSADTEGLEIYFSPMEYGGRSRPKVMFGMDNHSNSFGSVQSTILPDMQALGWSGYMAWSSNLNPWVGSTDLADTLSMVNDDGWTVCNHSLDHMSATAISLEADPPAVARQQYLDNAAFQVAEGFPANHVYRYSAQPENDMDVNLKDALDDMGFVYSRAINPTFISGTTAQYNNNWTGTFSINSRTAGGAAVDVQGTIDFALEAAVFMGCSINFFIHGLHDTQDAFMDFADWDYFIAQVTKYRDAGLIDLVSVDEWYKGLTYPRVPAGTRAAQ